MPGDGGGSHMFSKDPKLDEFYLKKSTQVFTVKNRKRFPLTGRGEM